MLIEIVAIVSLILNTVQFYFWLNRKKQDDSEIKRFEKLRRIKEVQDNYVALCEAKKDNGFSALFKSGIKTLQTDDEIEELIKIIMDKGYNSPLGREEEKLRVFGFKKFFNIATWDLMQKKTIDEIINVG